MVADETGAPIGTQQTIGKFETGKSRPAVLSVSTIQRTLELAGVEFPEGEPVRIKAKA